MVASRTQGPSSFARVHRLRYFEKKLEEMNCFKLTPESSALLLIDLEKAYVALPTAPHTSGNVMERVPRLADAFRARSGLVDFIRTDSGSMDRPLSDKPNYRDQNSMSGSETEICDLAGLVVVAGIPSDSGVESTVRHGVDLGFAAVVVEDACASPPDPERHASAFRYTFPRSRRCAAPPRRCQSSDEHTNSR
jgi:nicotinamidase-related amidase